MNTDPEQVLHHGKAARVSTPGGTYDVAWAHTAEETRLIGACDGLSAIGDIAFAASRIPE